MVSWTSLLRGLAFATAAVAQTSSSALPVARYCAESPGDGSICGSINLPATGTSTFLRVQAPTSAGWAAIGFGSGMAGSLIFLVYPSADGQNVTVSPRLGKGRLQPLFTNSIKLELLEGSGVSGGIMTANFRCANCRQWGNTKLNAKSTKQNLIWAAGPGEQIRSDDPEESITRHSEKGNFQLNLVTATGGDGKVNPFNVKGGSSSTGNGNGNGNGNGSGSGTGTGSTSSNDATSGNTGSSSVAAPMTKADKALIAHGVIMALTWVIMFPLGAAFIRLLNNHIPNAFAMHRGLQLFNVCLAIVGMALGMWTSGLNETHFTEFHQYFGVILIGMLFVQGALGHLHHTEFQRTKKRSAWSYMHIWTGRIVITLGIVNGGIGLGPRLADASSGQIAAYSIVSVTVVVAYCTFYFLKSRDNRRGVRRV